MWVSLPFFSPSWPEIQSLTGISRKKLIRNHVHIPNVFSVTEINVLFRATVHRAFIKIKFDVYLSATQTTLEQLDQHCDVFQT